jgi:uncharacterized protein YjeT (DUF2065 family)
MVNLLTALALLFILEGLLPFAAPSAWRTVMRRIGGMADGQIRFVGLAAILAGTGLLLFVL